MNKLYFNQKKGFLNIKVAIHQGFFFKFGSVFLLRYVENFSIKYFCPFSNLIFSWEKFKKNYNNISIKIHDFSFHSTDLKKKTRFALY